MNTSSSLCFRDSCQSRSFKETRERNLVSSHSGVLSSKFRRSQSGLWRVLHDYFASDPSTCKGGVLNSQKVLEEIM